MRSNCARATVAVVLFALNVAIASPVPDIQAVTHDINAHDIAVVSPSTGLSSRATIESSPDDCSTNIAAAVSGVGRSCGPEVQIQAQAQRNKKRSNDEQDHAVQARALTYTFTRTRRGERACSFVRRSWRS